MSRHTVAIVALISYVVCLVSAQDIVFPGETDRPSRYPLPTPKPTTPMPTSSRAETTTPPPGVTSVRPPTSEEFTECVRACPATSEYNPVCGTDGVVYFNPGRLSCSVRCGNNVEFVNYGQCSSSPIRG